MTATENVTRTARFSRTIHHGAADRSAGVETILESDSGQNIDHGVYARIKSTNLGSDTMKSIILFPEDVTMLRIALQELEARNVKLGL